MHSLTHGLKTVNHEQGQHVPIIVPDQFSLFQNASEMHCQVQGDPGTPILWSQVSGSPVTFTSALDVNPVTFTTASLGTQEFKCVTNPNTNYEMEDIGKFFHYPIDIIAPQRLVHSRMNASSLGNLVVTGSSNKAIGNVHSHGSVVVPSIYKKSRLRLLSEDEDVYTEYSLQGDFSILAESVSKTEFWGFIGGVWTLLFSSPNFVSDFSGYTGLEGNAKKAVYSAYSYGVASDIEVIFDSGYDTFAVSVGEYATRNSPLLHSTVSNYGYSLSTHVTLLNQDKTIEPNKLVHSSLSGLSSQFSSFTELQSSDTTRTKNKLTHSKITEYEYTLQLSTGVI